MCSETCVGRIRYLGVMLYDADRIQEAASVPDDGDLYEAQLKVFLDPFDPKVQAQARADGISGGLAGRRAKQSPVWKMAMDWKIAFPLHPEYRTLPMVWYVPPLSPIQAAAAKGDLGAIGGMPDVKSLRIPVEYLANLLTAGRTAAGHQLRWNGCWRCAPTCAPRPWTASSTTRIAERVGLSGSDIEDMYQLMAIANYEDRFVIPTAHRETGEDAFQTARLLRLLLRRGLLRQDRLRPVRRATSHARNPMEVV